MWRSPVSLLGRCYEALPNGCGMQRGRAGTVPVPSVLVLMAVALAGLNAPTPALAQAPGPESFAQEPRTPMELWSAIDYLVRTGQSKKAVPYLDTFMKSQADDATLVEIRDKYGAGSILRLADQPATSKYAQPLAERLTAAVRRHATQPERISRAVAGLTGTTEEQAYAVARLKEAGPYAVPFLVERSSTRRSRLKNEPSWLATWAGSIAPPCLRSWPFLTVPIHGSRPTQPRPWDRLVIPALSRS